MLIKFTSHTNNRVLTPGALKMQNMKMINQTALREIAGP